MGDEQSGQQLGIIIGKLDTMQAFLRDYIDSHDGRHTKIDSKLDEHSDSLSQAKGATNNAKWIIATVAGAAGAMVTFLGKKIF